MRNDAKPIIPPRQDAPSGPGAPGAPVRERAAPGPPQPSGGRLRDRTLERSARRGEGTEAAALDLDSGKRSFNVSVLMSGLAILAAILLVIVYFSWPEGPIAPQVPGEEPATQGQ